jgi:hypothetical protein
MAWEEAAVDAIKPLPGAATAPTTALDDAAGSAGAQLILLAALALPGLALAEEPPEQASLSIKYLDYQEKQPDLERIHVKSPSLELVVPVAGAWAVRAGLVSDSISGASPRYHTAVSGASRQEEERKQVDLGATRYFERATVSLSAGRSSEHDYLSRYASLQGSLSSADNNTTWVAGVGVINDRINPVNQRVVDERKRTVDLMVGVTQVVTPHDLVQVSLGHVRGRGYFSNPYKMVDERPRTHDEHTLSLRWNHYVEATDGSVRTGYRWFRDSYGITAHTLTGEYAQPLAGGWTLTPSLRLYSQSAADFYLDPVYDTRLGPPFPPGFRFGDGVLRSQDQRLAAFGARTVGIKVSKDIGRNWTVDAKLEHYRQSSSLRWSGGGSPGLQPLSARILQVGLTTRW